MFDRIDYSSLTSRQSIVKAPRRINGTLLIVLSGLTFAVGVVWAFYLIKVRTIVAGPPLPPTMPVPKPLPFPIPSGSVGPLVDDRARALAIDFFKNGQSDEKDRFGISLCRLEDPNPAYPGAKKRLFKDPFGLGSNTRIEVNEQQFVFGNKDFAAKYLVGPRNKRAIRDEPIPDLPKGIQGWRSVVRYEMNTATIEVAQKVIVVYGPTQHLDTVLVRYTVQNIGNNECTVALRILLGTYIGGRPDAPFYVPPALDKPGHWVDKIAVLHNREIPDHLHALESADLTDRTNVHALVGLCPADCELPTKCVICRPPNDDKGNAEWGNETPRFNDWVYQPIDEPEGSARESCVVIYWDKRKMNRGESRSVGYTYGLGRRNDILDPTAEVAVSGVKQMALHIDEPIGGRVMLVTAFLKGAKEEMVTLRLPPSVVLCDGEIATKPVVAIGDRAAVSWKVRVPQKGRFKFIADAPGIGRAIIDQWIDSSRSGAYWEQPVFIGL